MVLGGSLEMFQQSFDQLDPGKRSRLLAGALASYEDLLGLVNGVLDAAALTHAFPAVHCERVAVRQIVQKVLEHLNPQEVEAYTIQVQVDEQVIVWADPQWLSHVLANLFSNVFKYVPTQTIIMIEAVQSAPGSLVCLSVQDAGPGIPPEEVGLLFEKFVRLKRDQGGPRRGTGLGLSICKHFVQAMGGQIWVESSSRMGEGSRFCLTLHSAVERE